jgi:hypothetical protein
MIWLIVVLGVRVLPVCRLLQDPDRWGGRGCSVAQRALSARTVSCPLASALRTG